MINKFNFIILKIHSISKYLFVAAIAVQILCLTAFADFLKEEKYSLKKNSDNIVNFNNTELSDLNYFKCDLTLNSEKFILNNEIQDESIVQNKNPYSRTIIQIFAGAVITAGCFWAGDILLRYENRKNEDNSQNGTAVLPAWLLAPVLTGLSTYFIGVNYDETIKTSLGATITGASIGFLTGFVCSIAISFYSEDEIAFSYISMGTGTISGSIVGFIYFIRKTNMENSIITQNGDFNIPLPIIKILPDYNKRQRVSELVYNISIYSCFF